MRNHFDEQLSELDNKIVKMGQMCEEVIRSATNALINFSSSSADYKIKEQELSVAVKKTIETDREIDKMEREIEGQCFKLLLHQQPVARDLRKISAALKMISDMERIGDQASDIAEIIEYITYNKITHKVHIAEMSALASKMVAQSVEAYVNNDIELAGRVIAADDGLDELFCRVKSELVSEISSGESDGEECIDLLMIAKYLERIGDHATNIAEWAEYAVSGVHRNSEMQE